MCDQTMFKKCVLRNSFGSAWRISTVNIRELGEFKLFNKKNNISEIFDKECSFLQNIGITWWNIHHADVVAPIKTHYEYLPKSEKKK